MTGPVTGPVTSPVTGPVQVDVGSMDATLHLGFQRSISSLFQQAAPAPE